MSFDVKTDIMKAINGTNDSAMRTVLMLMLGVFETVNEKLDRAFSNEKAMRETVLNGHADSHPGHHEWIERRIKREPEIEALVAWAKARKQQEDADAQSGRKIRDGVVEKVIAAALIAIFGFLLGRGGLM